MQRAAAQTRQLRSRRYLRGRKLSLLSAPPSPPPPASAERCSEIALARLVFATHESDSRVCGPQKCPTQARRLLIFRIPLRLRARARTATAVARTCCARARPQPVRSCAASTIRQVDNYIIVAKLLQASERQARKRAKLTCDSARLDATRVRE